jgi:hypothetical protein
MNGAINVNVYEKAVVSQSRWLWQTWTHMNQRDLWAAIECDLTNARQMLRSDAAKNEAIRRYQEFIEHNELELACDALESYANENPVPIAFWIALRDAAMKMNLLDNAARFGKQFQTETLPKRP